MRAMSIPRILPSTWVKTLLGLPQDLRVDGVAPLEMLVTTGAPRPARMGRKGVPVPPNLGAQLRGLPLIRMTAQMDTAVAMLLLVALLGRAKSNLETQTSASRTLSKVVDARGPNLKAR